MSPADAQLQADFDAITSAFEAFFAAFSAQDWTRRHGRTWTFADVPYHLSYFNDLLTEAIEQGAEQPTGQLMPTMRDIDRVGGDALTRRPEEIDGAGAFGFWKLSLTGLRELITQVGSYEAPIWLPLMSLGGWRRLGDVVEYGGWHHWLHLCEASLRFRQTLPNLPPEVMHRALCFNMDITARSADAHGMVEPFTWALELTGEGGGEWTFHISDRRTEVSLGSAPNPTLSMRAAIKDYLAVVQFNLDPLMMAMLRGRVAVNSMRAAVRLHSLLTVRADRDWQALDRGVRG